MHIIGQNIISERMKCCHPDQHKTEMDILWTPTWTIRDPYTPMKGRVHSLHGFCIMFYKHSVSCFTSNKQRGKYLLCCLERTFQFLILPCTHAHVTFDAVLCILRVLQDLVPLNWIPKGYLKTSSTLPLVPPEPLIL